RRRGWQGECPPRAARKVRHVRSAVGTGRAGGSDERPEIVVRRLRARPPVLDADHETHARFGSVVAGERTFLALRAGPDLSHRREEGEGSNREGGAGNADGDEGGRGWRARVIGIAAEQVQLEARDRIAM